MTMSTPATPICATKLRHNVSPWNQRVIAVDRRRRREGIAREKLCVAAGVSLRSYCAWLAGERTPRAVAVKRLEIAIGELVQVSRPAPPGTALLFKLVVLSLSPLYALDPARVLAACEDARNGGVPGGFQAMQLRREAAYVVVTAFGIPASQLARAIGVSRQAVARMVQAVEEAFDHETQARLDRFQLIEWAA